MPACPCRAGCEEPFHEVHVLLRHRLVRQPGGLEGSGAVSVDLEANEEPVADCELVGGGAFRGHTALLSDASHLDKHEYALVVDINEPLGFETKLRPRPLSTKAARLAHASDHGSVRVDGGEVEDGVARHPVASGSGHSARICIGALDDLDVLLRHRLPSIPGPDVSALGAGRRALAHSRDEADAVALVLEHPVGPRIDLVTLGG